MFNGNIKDVFNNYGITGNPYIDTILLTNLIPVIIGYTSILSELLKKCILSFSGSFFRNLYIYLKNKIIGKSDVTMHFDKTNIFYPMIYKIFFDFYYK